MKTLALYVALISAVAASDDDAREILDKARAAYQKKDYDEVLKLTDSAIALAPENAEAHFLRGSTLMQVRKFEPAVAEFTKTLERSPQFVAAYDQRGTAYFKLGKIKEAISDYDQQIKLKPETGPAHWRRGLALYYAERFADGVKQFTSSDQQEPEDVENAVWHFLCNTHVKGIEKSRGELLGVKRDPRGETMMKVYELFKGNAKPDDVFAAAEAGSIGDDARRSHRFYANYYVGMYYESIGESKKSLELIKTAVENYPIGDYMMDVARVHIQLREKNDRSAARPL